MRCCIGILKSYRGTSYQYPVMRSAFFNLSSLLWSVCKSYCRLFFPKSVSDGYTAKIVCCSYPSNQRKLPVRDQVSPLKERKAALPGSESVNILTFSLSLSSQFSPSPNVLTRVCIPPTEKVALISCPFSVGAISSFCVHAVKPIAIRAITT